MSFEGPGKYTDPSMPCLLCIFTQKLRDKQSLIGEVNGRLKQFNYISEENLHELCNRYADPPLHEKEFTAIVIELFRDSKNLDKLSLERFSENTDSNYKKYLAKEDPSINREDKPADATVDKNESAYKSLDQEDFTNEETKKEEPIARSWPE